MLVSASTQKNNICTSVEINRKSRINVPSNLDNNKIDILLHKKRQNEQFSAILWQEQFTFRRDDLRFVLDLHD
jgi:hypothetical protein